MAGDIMVTVPYDDFILGIAAQTELSTIRTLVESGQAYCSNDIKMILGVPVKIEDSGGAKEDAGAD